MSDEITAGDIKWIVNDLGELGVEVNGRCFFCYKGESIEYDPQIHDDGTPFLYRRIGKREFGETIWPESWQKAGRSQLRYEDQCGTAITGPKPDDWEWEWRTLPTRQPG